jgi:hypothetical protein
MPDASLAANRRLADRWLRRVLSGPTSRPAPRSQASVATVGAA